MSTLEELSQQALARDASRVCLEYEGRSISWGDMRRVAEQLNAAIDRSGADPRAPIAFVPRNRPSALAAFLGFIARGHNIRMLYAFQSPSALARDIDRLGVSVVVAAADDFSDELRSALRQNGVAAVSLTEMDAGSLPEFERTSISRRPLPGRPSIEVLSSGTTGTPKHFLLGYDMIAEHIVGINLMSAAEAKEAASITPMLLYFPLANISGIYATLPVLLRGIPGILLDRFSLKAWHAHILKYRPNWGGLPAVGVQLILDANIPVDDMASLRFLGCGSAPIDRTVQHAFEKRYGIPVFNSYGATEFGGPVTAWNLELHAEWGTKKFGSVGRPFASAQLRAVDPETGAVLSPGTEGILEVISPRIGPAWIRTSDIGVVDEDGFVWLRGRADGAIMRGGFKVLPETIERALLLHTAISGVAVVGVPDTRLGEVPAAVIQVKPGTPAPTFAEIETHLRGHVLATHIPVYWRLVDALPYSPSAKVDRESVRRMFETLDISSHKTD